MNRTRPLLSSLPTSPASSSGSSILQRTASSLLPPIPLYRRLLRSHRLLLSYEMRTLGDSYVKDEFRRHRKIDNPIQIVGFLGQWKLYLDDLEAGLKDLKNRPDGERKFFEGRRLRSEEFEKLSEEQIYQLHEFMEASKELYNPTSPGPPPPPGAEGSEDPSILGGTGQNQNKSGQSEGDRVIADILDSTAKKS